MLRYAGRRLLGLAPIVLVVITLAFAANHLTPGDPVLMMLGTQSGDPRLMASLRHQYGLDQPLWRQYVGYLLGVLRGDFGLSYRFGGEP